MNIRIDPADGSMPTVGSERIGVRRNNAMKANLPAASGLETMGTTRFRLGGLFPHKDVGEPFPPSA